MKLKNYLFLIALICIGITLQAQTPELVYSANGAEYGELEIRGNFLYRGGLDHEIALTDISNTDFTTETVATGTASEISLRMTVSEDGSEVFINEFGSAIRSATLTSGVATLETLLDEALEVLGMDYYNNRVYFSTSAPQIISFSSNDPEGTLELLYDPASVLPIYNTHIEGDALYYSTQDSFDEPITYEIYKLDLTVTAPEPELVTTTPERIWSITTVGEFLYLLSDVNVITYRTEIANPAAEAPFYLEIPVSDVQDVFSIAHDGDYLYYTALGGAAGIYRIVDDALGLEEVTPSEITVYPNPTTDTLYITGLPVNSKEYTVINSLGLVVSTSTIASNTNFIDVAHLPSGLYFLSFFKDKIVSFVKN